MHCLLLQFTVSLGRRPRPCGSTFCSCGVQLKPTQMNRMCSRCAPRTSSGCVRGARAYVQCMPLRCMCSFEHAMDCLLVLLLDISLQASCSLGGFGFRVKYERSMISYCWRHFRETSFKTGLYIYICIHTYIHTHTHIFIYTSGESTSARCSIRPSVPVASRAGSLGIACELCAE